jgi:peptide-methionine (R)-S-oxide reductase
MAADKSGKAGPRLPQDQWNKLVMDGKISKEAYEVLHNANTERPFTSKLLKEGRAGTFKCAACDTPLFASSTKFNSGTGWPSFYEKLDGVELEGDNKMDMLMQRQEASRAEGDWGLDLGDLDFGVEAGTAPIQFHVPRYMRGPRPPDAPLPPQVHCTTCGGHLGHVFNDGNVWQTPTGKRYCAPPIPPPSLPY